MPQRDETEISRLLALARAGSSGAREDLFSLAYDELKELSRVQRMRWAGNHTLQTTGLLHEAYLKIVGAEAVDWRDRAHFFAVASLAMRQILINYAEQRLAQKRGGGAVVVPLEEANPVAPEVAEELLALNEALDRLGAMNERQRRVVEHRFFAGLTIAETAEVLGVSGATVSRDWALASAWLRRELSDAGFGPADPGLES